MPLSNDAQKKVAIEALNRQIKKLRAKVRQLEQDIDEANIEFDTFVSQTQTPTESLSDIQIKIRIQEEAIEKQKAVLAHQANNILSQNATILTQKSFIATHSKQLADLRITLEELSNQKIIQENLKEVEEEPLLNAITKIENEILNLQDESSKIVDWINTKANLETYKTLENSILLLNKMYQDTLEAEQIKAQLKACENNITETLLALLKQFIDIKISLSFDMLNFFHHKNAIINSHTKPLLPLKNITPSKEPTTTIRPSHAKV